MSLTKDAVVATAFDVIARHGAAKATVCDVADALGVSHGSIYRFFPTKAALREAVVGVWLEQIASAPEALTFTGTAVVRLRAWFEAYQQAKVRQRDQSPELFEAFRTLSAQEPEVIAAYKRRLVAQLSRMIAEGIASGELRPGDPEAVAHALLNATAVFHNPHFVKQWPTPGHTEAFDSVWTLLVQGISSSTRSSE